MAVVVDTRTMFEPKTPVKLFDGIYNLRSDSGISYAVDRQRSRFLMIRLADAIPAPSGICVVLKWFEELRRLTADQR
ncbi:MAG: hypothetical protein DMG09_17240 [Acidobacteria bacterium]|nr:MAG: hypothetical protein DMG09_17240 [Acidobacteriota bacterium]